ncbi:MAG: hypothetical protein QM711_01075 [Micropruina sp.]|uniref:hypothetical protein n=1 Tax=Micropruina sp. TaxID=2737536 RepID=UPI0039E540B3
MSEHNTRALRAARELNRQTPPPSGLFDSGSRTFVDALALVQACTAHGQEIPATFADGLIEHAEHLDRIGHLASPPPPFTVHDLAQSDHAERFHRTVLGKALKTVTAEVTREVRLDVYHATEGLLQQHLDGLLDCLNTAYVRAITDRRDIRDLLTAHHCILRRRPAPNRTPAGDWCVAWKWTQRAWNNLVDSTRPGMALPPDADEITLALACGAEPRLAPGREDAEQRARLHHKARQHQRAHQEHQQIATATTRVFEQAVTDATAANEREAAELAEIEELLAQQ